MSHESNRDDDLVRQAQQTPPLDAGLPPAVFRSSSGRIMLVLKPWYDDDHDEMMRELDGIIATLQEIRRQDGGAA